MEDSGMFCHCGVPAPIKRSTSSENEGRRFVGCGKFTKNFKCGSFEWIDDPPTCEMGNRVQLSLFDKLASLEDKILWQNEDLKLLTYEIATLRAENEYARKMEKGDSMLEQKEINRSACNCTNSLLLVAVICGFLVYGMNAC